MRSKKIFYFLKKVVRIIVLVYVGLGIVLFVFQNRFIYYPDITDFQDCLPFKDAEKISFNLSRGYFPLI